METAQPGDKVRVHYTGCLSDGTMFDSSRGREPLEFVVASGQVIVGFDNGVTGLKVGESRTVTIPAKDAYGEATTGGYSHPLAGKDLTFEIELVEIVR